MIIHQELKYHDKQLLGFPKKKKKKKKTLLFGQLFLFK